MRAWPNPPELLTETNETDVRWTAAPHPQAKTKSPCLARPNAGTNRSLIEGSVWPFGAHVLMDCRWATVEGSGGAFGLVGRGQGAFVDGTPPSATAAKQRACGEDFVQAPQVKREGETTLIR